MDLDLVAASRTRAVSSATPVFGFRSTKPKISMYKIDLRDTIMYEGYEQNHSTLFKKIDLEIFKKIFEKTTCEN